VVPTVPKPVVSGAAMVVVPTRGAPTVVMGAAIVVIGAAMVVLPTKGAPIVVNGGP